MYTNLKWQTRAMEALVGGATGLAVVVGYIVCYRATKDKADAGDWLNFAGVIVGVALTIGASKAIDLINAKAAAERKRQHFTLAIRAVNVVLENLGEGPQHLMVDTAMSLGSLWRVANRAIDELPDLNFNHRISIGIAQDAMEHEVPNLISNAQLAKMNADFVPAVRDEAAALQLALLPITDMFDRQARQSN